jgi:hypothetical protein
VNLGLLYDRCPFFSVIGLDLIFNNHKSFSMSFTHFSLGRKNFGAKYINVGYLKIILLIVQFNMCEI